MKPLTLINHVSLMPPCLIVNNNTQPFKASIHQLKNYIGKIVNTLNCPCQMQWCLIWTFRPPQLVNVMSPSCHLDNLSTTFEPPHLVNLQIHKKHMTKVKQFLLPFLFLSSPDINFWFLIFVFCSYQALVNNLVYLLLPCPLVESETTF